MVCVCVLQWTRDLSGVYWLLSPYVHCSRRQQTPAISVRYNKMEATGLFLPNVPLYSCGVDTEGHEHKVTAFPCSPFGCGVGVCCAVWLCRTSFTQMCVQVFNPITRCPPILLISMPPTRQRGTNQLECNTQRKALNLQETCLRCLLQ